MRVSVTISNIDIDLLRRQQRVMLEMTSTKNSATLSQEQIDVLGGLINLVDYIIDKAHGYQQ